MKYYYTDADKDILYGRSREGAWIEITHRQQHGYDPDSRSRKGAWIEIAISVNGRSGTNVAPVRERGLKFVQ